MPKEVTKEEGESASFTSSNSVRKSQSVDSYSSVESCPPAARRSSSLSRSSLSNLLSIQYHYQEELQSLESGSVPSSVRSNNFSWASPRTRNLSQKSKKSGSSSSKGASIFSPPRATGWF
jgi:hypothetical protein